MWFKRTDQQAMRGDVMVFLSKPEDLESVLVASRLQGVPLRVRIGGAAKGYCSAVLATITAGDCSALLIKPLAPEDGNRLLQLRRVVRIEFALQAEQFRTYSLSGIFLGTDTYDDQPALRVSYPDPRRDFRIEPALERPLPVAIQLAGARVTEYIFNICEGGIGFYCRKKTAELQAGTSLRIMFELPGGTRVESEAVVQWLQDIVPAQTVHGIACGCYCAAEFVRLDNAMRSAIISYIDQREQEEVQTRFHNEAEWHVL